MLSKIESFKEYCFSLRKFLSKINLHFLISHLRTHTFAKMVTVPLHTNKCRSLFKVQCSKWRSL